MAKKKAKKKTAKRAEPADARVARALQALAAVDRKDTAAIALVLGDALATIAEHLDSDALDETQRRKLARRIRGARRQLLGRRAKRARGEANAPVHVPTQVMPAVQASRIVMVGDAPSTPPVDAGSVPPPPSEPDRETGASVANAAPDASWLPKTLHMAGVVEGHEPTSVVLGLLREALASATTKRDPSDETAPAVRPLPVVLADLFGAFGLARSAPPRTDDDSKKS